MQAGSSRHRHIQPFAASGFELAGVAQYDAFRTMNGSLNVTGLAHRPAPASHRIASRRRKA
jgi:hypothetical protein